MKFKEIFNLIPATKYIGVVAKNHSEQYKVLYQGIASKCPPELGNLELYTLFNTVDVIKPILTIGVKIDE